jgi:23S rRNA (guanosine2251-2'-O)-methyltransferase
MFGKHPVEAALNNPKREKMNLWLTNAGEEALGDVLNDHRDLNIHRVDPDTLSAMVHRDSPHQGMVMEVRRLGTVHLEEVCKVIEGEANIILALDQVTDPHNIGAIMRSAIAFGAKAIVTPDRNSPPETGVLAKSAAGMLELLPWVRVTNLGNALDELAEAGYWRVGLDGDAKQELSKIDAGQNVVLVLGSEGKGMREGTQKKCDFVVKLPINQKVESLNVSNAAAVALYELGRK